MTRKKKDKMKLQIRHNNLGLWEYRVMRGFEVLASDTGFPTAQAAKRAARDERHRLSNENDYQDWVDVR